jgi:hypothetical protein
MAGRNLILSKKTAAEGSPIWTKAEALKQALIFSRVCVAAEDLIKMGSPHRFPYLPYSLAV